MTLYAWRADDLRGYVSARTLSEALDYATRRYVDFFGGPRAFAGGYASKPKTVEASHVR